MKHFVSNELNTYTDNHIIYLILCQESTNHTPLPCPSCAASSVKVDPELTRCLIVDNAGHTLYVHAPGHLVRANQHLGHTTLEVGQNLLSLPSGDGAGDFCHREMAKLLQKQIES